MVQSADMEERILMLKLRRIEQLNDKLRGALKRDRIPTSRAAMLIIESARDTPDPLVPSVWPTELNRYRMQDQHNLESHKSPDCCCIV